jgi:tRNA G18 (ribose-2'-O)-methylase SpoU
MNVAPKVDGKKIAELKRQKFLLKQQKKNEQQQNKKKDDEWFNRHSAFITRIDFLEAKKLKLFSKLQNANLQETTSRKRPRVEAEESSSDVCEHKSVTSTDKDKSLDLEIDPELLSKLEYLSPYFDLKDSNETSFMGTKHMQNINSCDATRYFIAEGTETVRMLLEQSSIRASGDGNHNDKLSGIKIHSIFTKPAPFLDDPVNLRKTLCDSYHDAFNFSGSTDAKEYKSLPFQVVVGTEKAMTEIVGFPVARGAMACGIVPQYDEPWLVNFLRKKYQRQQQQGSDYSSCSIRILALENICDTANLGSLIRSAAAFGIDAVILSDDSCDVWYRRCVRVSMGHVLTVPSVRVASLSSTLLKLRDHFQIKSYAAVIDLAADMILEETKKKGVSKNWCCVLGNEGNGLTKQMAGSCDHTIRIQMDGITDSLSIGVAGGILLHGMKEREE